MPRLTGRDGSSRLPLLIAGAIVLIAALAVGSALLHNSRERRSATPATTTPAVAAPSTDTDDDPPTGCLGGQGRSTSSVLTARRLAPHTVYGAVEVAAALTRWGLRYPYPTDTDLKAIRSVLTSDNADLQESGLASGYRGGYRSLPGRSDPSGTPYYVTTANGDWLLASGSTADRIGVQVEAHPVVDGAYSTKAVTLAVDLRWNSSGWQVHNFARADAAALASGGTTFTSGC